jgi:hypothetical protein
LSCSTLFFEDSEVVWLQPCDQTIIGFGDGNVHKRQVNINMDGLTWLDKLAQCVMVPVV